MGRLDYYIDVVKALGLSLEENGLGVVLENYRRRFHERMREVKGVDAVTG